jgi:hypothetical protein
MQWHILRQRYVYCRCKNIQDGQELTTPLRKTTQNETLHVIVFLHNEPTCMLTAMLKTQFTVLPCTMWHHDCMSLYQSLAQLCAGTAACSTVFFDDAPCTVVWSVRSKVCGWYSGIDVHNVWQCQTKFKSKCDLHTEEQHHARSVFLVWHLRYSQRWCLRVKSSQTLHCVVRWVVPNTSRDSSTLFFKVKQEVFTWWYSITFQW